MSDASKKQRILVVDDVLSNIELLGEMLISEYELIVATNGKEALEIAASKTPPDIILLDIMMPEMDGYEVCRRLKANELTRDIPVIFLTAKSEKDDEAQGLELGAADYITKPFKMPIVRARLRSQLELKNHRNRLEKMITESQLAKETTVTTEICDARQLACARGRWWLTGIMISVMIAMMALVGAGIASDRASRQNHERRISRLEATIEGNTARLNRIETKIDKLLEVTR